MADKMANSHALRSLRSIAWKEYQDEGAFGLYQGTPSGVPLSAVICRALRRSAKRDRGEASYDTAEAVS
jgi:hypothetical protein